MIPRQVAIVSRSANITGRQLCIVSAAIERQATRDFAPIWQIEPTVDPFLDLADVPAGYWPIVVLDDIHQRGAAGGALDRREGSPREQIDRKTDVSELVEGAPLSDEQRDRRAQSKDATSARALRLVEEIDERWPGEGQPG